MSNVIWNFSRKHNVPYNELVEFVHTVQATTMTTHQPQPVQSSEVEKFMDAAGLCRRCAAPVADAPIDMVLHCPACGMQHVDAPSPTDGQNLRMWSNPPHKSHLCRPEDGGCGHIWRPADVPTNGVASVKTNGKADSPVAQPVQAQPKGCFRCVTPSKCSIYGCCPGTWPSEQPKPTNQQKD